MPTATVLGLAYDSPVTEFPARTGPGTNYLKTAFTATKDTSGLKVLDVQEDANQVMSDFGRVYNWFQLEFPNGQKGWMRDHVIGIEGDFSEFGYGFVAPLKHAYLITRDPSTIPAAEPEPAASEVSSAAPTAASEIGTSDAPSAASEVSSTPTASSEVSTSDAPSAASEVSASEPESDAPLKVMKKSSARMRPTEPANVIIQRAPGTALNARSEPTTMGSTILFTIPTKARAKILEVIRQDFGQKFRWFKVDYEGQQAWVREDFCRVEGDSEEFDIPWDLYPAPMKDEGWWVRDFNYKPDQDTNVWEHWGWDFGAITGTPIYCGPEGGKVAQVMDCSKCSSARPSTVLNGLQLGDPSTYSDPGWGYGYGNFVVVGYRWDLLPESTQGWMKDNGFEGGSAFVMHAHLHERKVTAGMELSAGQVIATCGNTGNSEASHLHLELRYSKTDNYPGWSGLINGLTNPVTLFSR